MRSLYVVYTRMRVCRLLTGSDDDASIDVINHPLPVPHAVKSGDTGVSAVISSLIAFSLALSMAFPIATFVIFPIKVSAIRGQGHLNVNNLFSLHRSRKNSFIIVKEMHMAFCRS